MLMARGLVATAANRCRPWSNPRFRGLFTLTIAAPVIAASRL